MEMSLQPELLAAQITGYVHTDLVTYCLVTHELKTEIEHMDGIGSSRTPLHE
jgi:hypothetical protein